MRILLCLSLLVIFLASCAEVKTAAKKDEPPGTPSVSIPSPTAVQVEKERKIEVRGEPEVFSFSLRDAEVKDVMRAISRQTDYNVVVEPDVKGAVTVDLKNVTLGKALDYVLDPLGYTYKIENKTIYVSKPKIETRVFFLNYIAMKRVGLSTLRGTITTSSGTGSTAGAATTTSTTSTAGTTAGSGSSASGRAEVLSLRSETEADMWKDVEADMQNFLSKEGRLVVNKLASTIVVSDYMTNLRRVALYLEAIEGTIQRQVLIQARLVEVQLTDTFSAGINWRIISGSLGEFRLTNSELVTQQPSVLFPITADAVASGTINALTAPFFRFGVANGNFESFLSLLKTQGKVKVLSNPKIATLNNQRAMIKVATEDVSFETTTVVASGSPATTSTVTKYVTIGVMLDVTPQVDDKGNIILNIHPVVTDKLQDKTSPKGDATAPVVNVRETDAMVRMKDGETVIIGGLLQDKEDIEESGVPGLMSLPFIGKFFKAKSIQKQKTELVIFITPTIIIGNEGL